MNSSKWQHLFKIFCNILNVLLSLLIKLMQIKKKIVFELKIWMVSTKNVGHTLAWGPVLSIN